MTPIADTNADRVWTLADYRAALLDHADWLDLQAEDARNRAAVIELQLQAHARGWARRIVSRGGRMADLARALCCDKAQASRIARKAGVRFRERRRG